RRVQKVGLRRMCSESSRQHLTEPRQREEYAPRELLSAVCRVERRDLAHGRIYGAQGLQWCERAGVGGPELHEAGDAAVAIGAERDASYEPAHAVGNDEHVSFGAIDRIDQSMREALQIVPPVERMERRAKAC